MKESENIPGRDLDDDLPSAALDDKKGAAAIERLKARRDALSSQANQLVARASHLSRVVEASARRVERRRDAHEKIILGALMVMVRLDRFRLTQTGTPIVVDTVSKRSLDGDKSMLFDVDFLIGALLTLSQQLNSNETTTIAQRNALRQKGSAFRALSKAARKRLFQ